MRKKKTNSRARVAAWSLLAAALLVGAPLPLAPVAHAQQVSSDKPRTLDGHVQLKSGAPATGAVVYLKDTKTLTVRSFLADDKGAFHFNQLSQNTDYDVWAEQGGQRSKTKRISSFSDKLQVEFTLEIG